MISAPLDGLRKRAARWREAAGDGAEVVESRSAIGGGSLPGETLPSVALRLDPDALGTTADRALACLRERPDPIIGRIEDGRVLLDPRTVLPGQDDAIADALAVLGRSP